MAREEAKKRATQGKNWDVGSKMNIGPRALDYVQFTDRGYQVILFATNCQGEITKGLSETCLDNGQTAVFVENFIRLVQEDDRFYPVPAMKHILEAICNMAERERNHKAWKIGKSAEEMLNQIEESRSRKRMNAS